MKRLKRKFLPAFKGLKLALQDRSIRIQLGFALCALAAAACFRFEREEWVLTVLMIGLVITAETFNTAVELLCDRVCPQQDPLIGKVKDLAAAAVLLASLTALVGGAVLVIGHLF